MQPRACCRCRPPAAAAATWGACRQVAAMMPLHRCARAVYSAGGVQGERCKRGAGSERRVGSARLAAASSELADVSGWNTLRVSGQSPATGTETWRRRAARQHAKTSAIIRCPWRPSHSLYLASYPSSCQPIAPSQSVLKAASPSRLAAAQGQLARPAASTKRQQQRLPSHRSGGGGGGSAAALAAAAAALAAVAVRHEQGTAS